MEYPETKFTKPYRIILLAIFIAAFFIISPLTILYTAGYRFDWHNGLLRETGSISIDVLPKNVNIFLDGILLNYKMPIRLNDIAPHKYQIKFSLLGYYDWQKEIEVKNKQTTYLKDIALIKKGKPELILKGKIDGLTLSNDGRYLAYILEKDKNSAVWIRNLKNGTDSLATVFTGMEKFSLTWDKKNNYLLINNQTAPFKKVIIVNGEDAKEKTDLIKITGLPIQKLEWKNSLISELYFGTATGIYSFHAQTKETSLITLNNFISWQMDNGELWTIQTNTTTNGLLLIRDTLGFKENFITINLNDGQLAPAILNNWQFVWIHNNNILLKNSSWENNFLLLRKDKNQNGNSLDRQFIIPGTEAMISKYDNWWLMWTPFELWTYVEGQEPYLLNRSGEEMTGITPIDKNNTLALIWKSNASILFPYYSIQHEFIDQEISFLAADSDKRIVYFVNKNGLWRLNY